MNYSSNLPAGAESDPRAPWNESNNEQYEQKSYIVSYTVSYVIDDPVDMDEDIRLMSKELNHIGFIVDHVEYEEI